MPDQDFSVLQDEVRDIRTMMGKMAEALTKLSVLEERNLNANQAIEKAMTRVEKLDERMTAVILNHATFEARIGGMATAIKFMWGICGAGVIGVIGATIKHFAS